MQQLREQIFTLASHLPALPASLSFSPVSLSLCLSVLHGVLASYPGLPLPLLPFLLPYNNAKCSLDVRFFLPFLLVYYYKGVGEDEVGAGTIRLML